MAAEEKSAPTAGAEMEGEKTEATAEAAEPRTFKDLTYAEVLPRPQPGILPVDIFNV